MDLALHYSASVQGLDLRIDAEIGDLAREDTLTTAVMLSLLCDRTAQAHEVDAGGDRRGWWADAFAVANADAAGTDAIGSRLWLLAREKQIPETLERLRAYIREALQWLVEDGLADDLIVTVFVPRAGWYVAMIDAKLRGQSRRFRFEWNPDAQSWRLAGEVH